MASSAGRVLWEPPDDVRTTTEVGRYLRWLETARGLRFDGYWDLWRWSVEDLRGFWTSIWDFFEVRAHAPSERVLGPETMPGATWFPGARLNFAEHLVGDAAGTGAPAVVAYSQTRPPVKLSFGEFREQVARARAGFRRLGVGPGDRVAAYLPNMPETLVAFTAAASLGAVWASCAPELGPHSVTTRLAQLEPTVLLTIGSYGFRDRIVDRRGEVAAIRTTLPSVRQVVDVPYGPYGVPDSVGWAELLADRGPLRFDPVPFDHPLFVLFTSGTTGKPKAIVHGHGGTLLEQLKSQALRWDLKPGGRLLWFTTTTWMVWNALVSALLVRSSVVMIDGHPTWPDVGWQWRLAEETRPTCMGANPAFVMASRAAGLEPGRDRDLHTIRIFATAGSPLPPEGYRYLSEQFGPRTQHQNGSGGTDVCTGIVSGSPLLPVYEGEISGPCLGVAAHAFNDRGERVVDEPGELVITKPMPSMPVGFLEDPDGSRYRSTYFEHFPGVWRQGDLIRFLPRGSCVLLGRSDATLNRGGVRLGTSEFYDVVEAFSEIDSSLVVHLEDDAGGPGELLLFVVLSDDVSLDEQLRGRIAGALRSQLSPRHAPDRIVEMPAIPRTPTGKKLETPVKRLLKGAALEDVTTPDALADPEAMEAFADFARRISERPAAVAAPSAPDYDRKVQAISFRTDAERRLGSDESPS